MSTSPKRKLSILFFDAGGGHRNAAQALNGVLSENWDVSLVNFQELLKPIDLLYRYTGFPIQDIYNYGLRKGWTRYAEQMIPVLQAAIKFYHEEIVDLLAGYWAAHPTDLVLSVIPHFNREIADSVSVPFVTLITDFADFPPHFWIEKETQHIICGTETAVQQARAAGVPHIHPTSGMIMKPAFYNPQFSDKENERIALGLDPHKPTGVVLFGGNGSPVMLDIVERLDKEKVDVQLILLCGNNKTLLKKALQLDVKIPLIARGFTPDVGYYMSVSDFLIGKPGPGCISEALQYKLPVIVECNKLTLPQERYNAQWVLEQGVGITLTSFDHIALGVQALLQPLSLEGFRSKVSQHKNNALYEVAAILDKIVAPVEVEALKIP